MRVSDSEQSSPASNSRSQQTSRIPLLVFSLVAAFILGFLTHQYRWYAMPLQWGAALTTWRARAGLPVVALEMRFSDYQRLDALRERGLRLGAHVPFEEESVPAVLLSDTGGRKPVMLRLPGGPVVQVPRVAPGTVWSLELLREPDDDWQRLTPVDESRAVAMWQQWGYLETLRREGFAAATQTLVRLEINGTAWGLYMLETPAPVSVAARFDAHAAWETQAAGEPVTDGGFRYAHLIAEGVPLIAAEAAHTRLWEVHTGERPLSAVCDAEALGRFLALTMLWTGQPTPDWRALRWTYDPVTQQLAPVGAGQPWPEHAPLPQAFLDDPVVQAATARALAEFARPAYLEHLRAELGPSLEILWPALGMDAADVPWTRLVLHQQEMRARLNPEHALAATLTQDGATLTLYLANRQPFPLHIVGLDAGGAGLRALNPAWVLPEDRARLVEAEGALVLHAAADAVARPTRLHLPREIVAAGGVDLILVSRLWGMDGPLLRVPVREPARLFEVEP